MPQPYRIVDLNNFVGNPAGTELAEISVAGTGSFQIPIQTLVYARAPIIVSSGGTVLVTGTTIGDILVTTSSAVTIQLPQASLRSGAPVSVIAQQTTTPNITILPFSGETLIGLTQLTITNSYGAFTLWPISTGGWYQK